MTSRYMKICSIPLIIEERQIKTMIRYHLTTVRMSTTKTQGKCWKGHEEMRTTVHVCTVGVEKATASTPVLLPGKSHGWGSLVGYSPWGRRVRHN